MRQEVAGALAAARARLSARAVAMVDRWLRPRLRLCTSRWAWRSRLRMLEEGRGESPVGRHSGEAKEAENTKAGSRWVSAASGLGPSVSPTGFELLDWGARRPATAHAFAAILKDFRHLQSWSESHLSRAAAGIRPVLETCWRRVSSKQSDCRSSAQGLWGSPQRRRKLAAPAIPAIPERSISGMVRSAADHATGGPMSEASGRISRKSGAPSGFSVRGGRLVTHADEVDQFSRPVVPLSR
ncbi:hypothetical protein EJ065_2783 [Corallococcus coralloides]|uniref:Uncharacterized protein n=1 Tax=Corallococcus coralloides TaxID=184914 RepID=A0A410RR27_CORCK|nr:hypothetical protein EJ065_2783 [Corallococcus coralloides]